MWLQIVLEFAIAYVTAFQSKMTWYSAAVAPKQLLKQPVFHAILLAYAYN